MGLIIVTLMYDIKTIDIKVVKYICTVYLKHSDQTTHKSHWLSFQIQPGVY